ncbi:hypothetical protein VE01_05795 [Pseudogymnoascus verrucosus]|uniref:Uncharacterized protein n=1 Tax=Pseudogymnoascus verrucosus TaxID=342668 RepID=A0A1B8GKD1_9PEZI|nr:uncharacterized protein VE01_05795 [Pseudogymnoascus verrucosus]OBT96284.1 hypothetical protein VE01_05795 [Pseudogymnoascus verrucosus]
MDSGDQVMQFFDREYNKALALYNDGDKEEECIAAAQDLLQKPDLPRYHRIMTLILLSAASTNWNDAEDSRLEAERLWDQTHRHYSRVDDPDASQTLTELRVDLDVVKELQIEELEKLERMFGEYDGEYDVDDEEEGDEEEYEKEQEREEDVEIDVDVDAAATSAASDASDAAPTALSNAASDTKSERSLHGTEGNTPDVASCEHAMDKVELSASNEAEDATNTKSDEGTEDQKAPATTQRRNKLTGACASKLARKVVWPIVPASPLFAVALQVVNSNMPMLGRMMDCVHVPPVLHSTGIR